MAVPRVPDSFHVSVAGYSNMGERILFSSCPPVFLQVENLGLHRVSTGLQVLWVGHVVACVLHKCIVD